MYVATIYNIAFSTCHITILFKAILAILNVKICKKTEAYLVVVILAIIRQNIKRNSFVCMVILANQLSQTWRCLFYAFSLQIPTAKTLKVIKTASFLMLKLIGNKVYELH